MTYFGFHCRFNFPLLLFLFALNSFDPWQRGEVFSLLAVLAVVIFFTTPWDNLAVKWKIWGFDEKKVLFKIGYLPIEEYLFFILQTVNVILAARFFLSHFKWQTHLETPLQLGHLILIGALFLGWIQLGFKMKRDPLIPKWNYAVHLFFWFLPVLITQWILATEMLHSHRALLFLLTVGFGSYYTVADLIAVRSGIWFFNENQVTGLKLSGILPWEEIAFFFLTSLLVAQSYLLLAPVNSR